MSESHELSAFDGFANLAGGFAVGFAYLPQCGLGVGGFDGGDELLSRSRLEGAFVAV